MLEARGGEDVRVFVVWEPVIVSDVAPPSNGDLARCHDPRAAQYWDPKNLVSHQLTNPRGPTKKGIVWDYVAVFPPGATWGAALPSPSFEDGPVVEVEAELRAVIKPGRE